MEVVAREENQRGLQKMLRLEVDQKDWPIPDS